MTLPAAAPAAVVFDLDGTLLDTEPLYNIATQKVLDPHGHTYSMELKKRCMGGDSRRTAQLTIDEYALPMSIDEFLAERESHLRPLFMTSPEIGGAGDFVRLLAARKIPAGLATSSHDHICRMKLSTKAWAGLLAAIVCGDDARVRRGKPAPDIFLACAEALGVDPAHCLAFEDSPTGIAAARAAGMTVIAIDSPWVLHSDLAEADAIVTDFAEVIPIASGW